MRSPNPSHHPRLITNRTLAQLAQNRAHLDFGPDFIDIWSRRKHGLIFTKQAGSPQVQVTTSGPQSWPVRPRSFRSNPYYSSILFSFINFFLIFKLIQTLGPIHAKKGARIIWPDPVSLNSQIWTLPSRKYFNFILENLFQYGPFRIFNQVPDRFPKSSI